MTFPLPSSLLSLVGLQPVLCFPSQHGGGGVRYTIASHPLEIQAVEPDALQFSGNLYTQTVCGRAHPSSPLSVQNLLQQPLTLERDHDLQKSKLRPRVFRPLGCIFPSKCPQLLRMPGEGKGKGSA